MSRSLSANATSAITKKEGVESILQVYIHYGGGNYFDGGTYYASKTLTDAGKTWDGRILNFSGLNSSQRAGQSGTIASISITLDDSDGELKDIFETQNLENIAAEVRQYFDGFGGLGTVLFKGEIVNPVVWNEGDQTADITLESLVQSNEFGFAIEEGGRNNNDHAFGKMWPVVFGKAGMVPAPLITRNPITELDSWITFAGKESDTKLYQVGVQLKNGKQYTHITVPDNPAFSSQNVDRESGITSLDFDRFNVKDASRFPDSSDTYPIDLDVGGVLFKGYFNINTKLDQFHIIEANAVKYTAIPIADRDLYEDDPDYNNTKVFWVNETLESVELIGQHLYFKKGDLDGYYFNSSDSDPDVADSTGGQGQNERIVRRVVQQTGNKIELDEEILDPNKKDKQFLAIDLFIGKDKVKDGTFGRITEVRALSMSGLVVSLKKYMVKIAELQYRRQSRKDMIDDVGDLDKSGYGAIVEVLNYIKEIKSLFWGKGEGTPVRLWGKYHEVNEDGDMVPTGVAEDVYVANAVESTAVLGIWALRSHPEGTILQGVSPRHYTVNLNNETIGPSYIPNVTTISFPIPLSAIPHQGWKDQIFVTVDSTLSSNTATQIKWILDNYTNLDTDSSTFSSVASAIATTPSNFAVLQQRDALNLAEDMAWQARCGLTIDSETVKITLLADKPGSSLAISESNCEFDSVIINTTSRNDIVTRLNGRWREDYSPGVFTEEEIERASNVSAAAPKTEEVYVNDQNVNIYGLVEQDKEIFIYNNEDSVARTIDFWLNRYANIWRKVKLSTFHGAIALEVFDGVNLNFNSSDILGTSSIRAVVEATNNTITDGRIALELWLPAIAGNTIEQTDAWQGRFSSTPDNPVDVGYFERTDTAYRQWPEDIILGNEIQQHFKTLFDNQIMEAMITRSQSSPMDQATIDIYAEGLGNEPTHTNERAFILDPTVDLAVGAIVKVKPTETGAWYITNFQRSQKFTVAITGFHGQEYWNAAKFPPTWAAMEHVQLYGFIEVELQERAYDEGTGVLLDQDDDSADTDDVSGDSARPWATSKKRNFNYVNVLGGRWGTQKWPHDGQNKVSDANKPAINLAEIHNTNNNPTSDHPTPYYVYLTNINHALYPRFFQPIPPSANEFAFWDYFLITELTETINSKGHLIRYINLPGVHDGSC